jgi:hypothetical protein
LCSKKNILFEVGSRYASILHTRLRLHNSSLNYDLFQHNCISSPACACGYYRETCKHHLLDCSHFQANNAQLLTSAADCLNYHWTTVNDNVKLNYLLHGCNKVDFHSNRILFLAVQDFIINSKRFVIT